MLQHRPISTCYRMAPAAAARNKRRCDVKKRQQLSNAGVNSVNFGVHSQNDACGAARACVHRVK